MKSKKILGAVMGAVMVLMAALAITPQAWAADGDEPTAPTITAHLDFYANPNYDTSSLKWTIYQDPVKATGADEITPPGGTETITVNNISMGGGYVSNKTADITLPKASTLSKAGFYKWDVKVMIAGSTLKTYTITACVVNTADGLAYYDAQPYTITDKATDDKVEEIRWNKAIKNDDTLKVNHITSGAFADPNKEFNYTITIQKPSWYDTDNDTAGSFDYATMMLDSMVDNEKATYDEASKTYTINQTFKNGGNESYSIPQGAIVSITGAGATDYVGAGTYTAKNPDGTDASGTIARAYNGDGSKNTQAITITETRDEVPSMTGIAGLGDNWPVVLIGAMFSVLALLAISKRRRSEL